MGCNAKSYRLYDTGDEATSMRRKWLGDLASANVQLIVENPGEGEDESGWFNFDNPPGICKETGEQHVIQSTIHSMYVPENRLPPIKGPFRCKICDEIVKVK